MPIFFEMNYVLNVEWLCNDRGLFGLDWLLETFALPRLTPKLAILAVQVISR